MQHHDVVLSDNDKRSHSFDIRWVEQLGIAVDTTTPLWLRSLPVIIEILIPH